MFMNPSTNLCNIDAYPDADFAGMFGHKKPVDPSCVKSYTRFIITFAEADAYDTANALFLLPKLSYVLFILAHDHLGKLISASDGKGGVSCPPFEFIYMLF